MLSASLPMYQTPANAVDWDTLWGCFSSSLREAGFDAPAQLAHPADLLDHWRAPDLLLSQTCALPFRRYLTHSVSVLGSFDFSLPDCQPGEYNSFIITRIGESWEQLRAHGRPAINDHDSQSGANVLIGLGIDIKQALVTGAHVKSASAVIDGSADFAAIDAQTWRLIDAQMRDKLHVIVRSKTTPGLPLISAKRFDAKRIVEALELAMADIPPEVLTRLCINGFVRMKNEDYLDASAF